MNVHIKSDNRVLVLRIMQERLGQKAVYHPLPMFSYTVGPYTLTRESCIETESDCYGLFPVFASLGMCDYPIETHIPVDDAFTYPLNADSAAMMLNLISIISARQTLLNRALDRRDAFFVSPSLMHDLIAHPPTTIPAFLQSLYSRDHEYKGLAFSLSCVSLSGFLKCRPEESEIHRQLSGLIMQAAANQKWVKPFTPRVRNQKYAFRTWLNSIGMTGTEYEIARRTLLSRLPGRGDQRRLPGRKEG